MLNLVCIGVLFIAKYIYGQYDGNFRMEFLLSGISEQFFFSLQIPNMTFLQVRHITPLKVDKIIPTLKG